MPIGTKMPKSVRRRLQAVKGDVSDQEYINESAR